MSERIALEGSDHGGATGDGGRRYRYAPGNV